MDLDIQHNIEKNRFETTIDQTTAYISYVETGDTLIYDHTIVPKELGGKGIGSALVKHALEYATYHRKQVVPQCSFVAHYIDKHQEYAGLVAS